MTTTVYDTIQKIVASDSRWSVPLDSVGYPDHVLYVDDTGFDKVSERKTHVIVLAGDGQLIADWKRWWEQDALSEETPAVEITPERTVSLSIINKETNSVDFDCGHKLAQVCPVSTDILAVFSGSGGNIAAVSWADSGCPKTAIEEAKSRDPYTGGNYKFVDYQKNISNLGNHTSDYSVIETELRTRGKIMNLNQVGKPVSINDVNEADTLKAAISTGKLVASAPTGGKCTFQWDEKAKQKLSNVLQSVREAEGE